MWDESRASPASPLPPSGAVVVARTAQLRKAAAASDTFRYFDVKDISAAVVTKDARNISECEISSRRRLREADLKSEIWKPGLDLIYLPQTWGK